MPPLMRNRVSIALIASVYSFNLSGYRLRDSIRLLYLISARKYLFCSFNDSFRNNGFTAYIPSSLCSIVLLNKFTAYSSAYEYVDA